MSVVDSAWPWAPGAATGVGSLPGTDVAEAAAMVFGELPDLPHLPELPARGPGAEMTGRGAGLLVDLPVELYAGRWRVTARPGRDLRRTRDILQRDLDALTDAGDGYTGPVKVQAAGPWTLAATLDLPVGGRVLHDHGAARDLADSLAAGLADHVAQVRRRLPGASVVVQLDEPSLPAVLTGRIPTESGLHTLRAVAGPTARDALATVIGAAGAPVVVHCCAAAAPVGLLVGAGAAGVSLDLGLLDLDAPAELDALGEALDAGHVLFAGAVPTAGEDPPSGKEAAAAVLGLWRRLGFPVAGLPAQVVVTPACGLAGAAPEYARSALAACVEAGRRLLDEAA
jgi:methionine synthase II (cobalamin-independent)